MPSTIPIDRLPITRDSQSRSQLCSQFLARNNRYVPSTMKHEFPLQESELGCHPIPLAHVQPCSCHSPPTRNHQVAGIVSFLGGLGIHVFDIYVGPGSVDHSSVFSSPCFLDIDILCIANYVLCFWIGPLQNHLAVLCDDILNRLHGFVESCGNDLIPVTRCGVFHLRWSPPTKLRGQTET